MKNLLIIVLFLNIYIPHSISQPHTSWLNYSFSQRVTGINIKGNDVWISTQGGLVKYNKTTSEKTYYNRANSNLPDNNLLGLFCNTNGDVWVGGKYYGIGKFTGVQCSIYNQMNSGLPFDQYNHKIQVDKNGNIWVASFRWMARFNGSSWKTWTTGNDLSAFPIISDFLIDDKGVVWICSTDGFGKIENDEYSIIPGIYGGINQCMGIDNNENLWIGIEGRGLYLYTGGTSFTNYNTSNSCLPTNLIYAISFDSENNMWLATAEGLVNFKTTACNIFSPPISEKALLRVKADNNDTIWCGSFNGKLLCFDGFKFSSIELSNSPLKDNYITDILTVNDNTTWIGTKKNTVIKTTTQFYSVFNKQANAFAQDKGGAIWVAFGSGDTCLLKIDADESIVFDSLNSPLNTKKILIRVLAVDNNNHIWISTKRQGLYKYDGLSFTNYNMDNSAIPSNQITEFAFDKDNVLWGGSLNGLFKFDGTNWTVWDTENSNIPTNLVNGLTIDAENKVWFSCMDEDRIVGREYGGGLTCFDGQTMTTYNINNSGLLSNTIFGIYIDENIWLATWGAGLMFFDKKDKWITYNVTNSGIANNLTQGITRDKEGNLWIGHNDAGISVFNPDSSIQPVNIYDFDKNNSSLFIFPNPVNNDLYLKLNTTAEKNIESHIYDLNGRLVLTLPNQTISQNNPVLHFQLQNLLQNNHIYILNINCDGKQFNAKFLFDE